MDNEQLNALRFTDVDAYVREIAHMALDLEKDLKRNVVETNGGPDDVPQRIVYMAEDDDKANLIMPAVLGADPAVAEIIAVTVKMCRERFGPPMYVAFFAEAYMQIYPDARSRKDVPRSRGELTQRFNTGDMNVSECLQFSFMYRSKNQSLQMISCSCPFSYDDRGMVIFGEPLWTDTLADGTEAVGAVPDAMASAFGWEQN